MQQNRECRLCDDRDETINHIRSKCNKLAPKKYKTRHDWVGKMIHWELCKKFKYDHMNKWYMHNPEFVLENEMHKVLWDFEIQTDHLILARQPDFVRVNKKEILLNSGLFHMVKLKESEKKDKYLEFAGELKKLWNMKVTVISIVIGALGTVTKGLIKGLEDLEIRRWTETTQMTALLRSARILRRVLETWGNLLSFKVQWQNHQQMLVRKTLKRVK